MSSDLRLALLGFGHVGRRFAELLRGTYARVLRDVGVRPRVTGIATLRHGSAIDPRGLPLRRCLALVGSGRSLQALHRGAKISSAADFIRRVPADVLLELTPLDPRAGEPASTHVRLALRRGLHVVTANKGPVAFALGRLQGLARRRGVLFRHEGAVMEGAPVFNLVARCLPGVRVLGFRGILNSTTSHILSRMEQGATAVAALKEAQALGIAEADPRHDLDGWDAAVKGCAIANALMGASMHPSQARRRGIRGVSVAQVRRIAREGARLRLVVRGIRRGPRVRISVGPERIPAGDPLCVSGADTVLVIATDLMGEIGILERGGAVDQTAYALLSDLVAAVRAGFT